MTGKERIRLALAHKEADRVPVDFGGCAQTTIHVGVIAGIRDHFGPRKEPVKIEEPYTMMDRIKDDLKEALGTDVDAVPSQYSFFGIPRNGWKEYRMKDGLEVLVPKDFNVTVDGKGDILMHPKGDVSTVARVDFKHELFDRQTDLAIVNLERIAKAIGDGFDVAWVCGTDFGTQSSTFCSIGTYTNLCKPYYHKVNDWIHANTSWKTFKHCCGAVESFMDAFIDSGFDIINPVQWTARGMEPKLLKKKYGSRITFRGAGVDTQKTLP